MVIHDEKSEYEMLRRTEYGRENSVAPFERLAAPLSRFAAFVVDYFVIVWPFITLTTSPFTRQIKEAMLVDDEFSIQMLTVVICAVGFCTVILYQALFHWLAGTTPGKFVFGLRIVPLWSKRDRPTIWSALGRAVFWVLEFTVLGLPFLAIMSEPNRRPWHDRLTNMVVVSVRKRGSAMTPNIYEVAIVRMCTWVAVSVLMVGGLFFVVREFRDLRRNFDITKNAVQDMEASAPECEAIDDALEEWPQEHGEAPQRLSVAMALFATGDLDKSCLKTEVEAPLAIMEHKTLAYLAKSFVYSDDQELSDKYLEEVCKTEEKSDECRLARVIEAMADENIETIEKQFTGLSSDSRVYLSLWALRQYVRMQDFVSAAKFLDHIPDHRALAYFTVPSRAKVYWGLHRSQEARATAAAALDILSGNDKLQFSSWLCFAELANSCEARSAQSCKVFARMNDKVDDGLSDFQPALTKVKVSECEPGGEVSGLTLAGLNPDVRQYAELLAHKNLAAMAEFWGADDTRFELKDEVAQQIIKLTDERKYLDPIRTDWLKRSRGLAWEQLGRSLFSHDMLSKNWVAAYEVGERLLDSVGEDRSLSENFVVTAFHAGEKGKAVSVLNRLLQSGAENLRTPASNNDFSEVRRLLKSSAGHK